MWHLRQARARTQSNRYPVLFVLHSSESSYSTLWWSSSLGKSYLSHHTSHNPAPHIEFIHRLNIDHNDPSLFEAYDNSDVAASPITTVFRLAGFGAAVHIVNAVLLTAVLSATNSCFFASSRMLMSLAQAGRAPKVFGWVTKRGVPVPALLCVIPACLPMSHTED